MADDRRGWILDRLNRECLSGLLIIGFAFLLFLIAARPAHIGGFPNWYTALTFFMVPVLFIIFQSWDQSARKFGDFAGVSRIWKMLIVAILVTAAVAYLVSVVAIAKGHYTTYDLLLTVWSLISGVTVGALVMRPLGRERIAGNG